MQTIELQLGILAIAALICSSVAACTERPPPSIPNDRNPDLFEATYGRVDDLAPNTIGRWSFLAVNPLDEAVRIEITAKSCSCIETSVVPLVLAPGGASEIVCSALPAPHGELHGWVDAVAYGAAGEVSQTRLHMHGTVVRPAGLTLAQSEMKLGPRTGNRRATLDARWLPPTGVEGQVVDIVNGLRITPQEIRVMSISRPVPQLDGAWAFTIRVEIPSSCDEPSLLVCIGSKENCSARVTLQWQ